MSDSPLERFCAERLSGDAVYKSWPVRDIRASREVWEGHMHTRLLVSTTSDEVKCERKEGGAALLEAARSGKRGAWVALPPIRNVDVCEKESDWDKEKLLFLYLGAVLGVKHGTF